jgi:hypothetical protein
MTVYGPLSERSYNGNRILLRDGSWILLRGGQQDGERLGRYPNEVTRLWETRKQQKLEDAAILQLIQEFLEING